jgi:hypothetical protein
MVREWEAGRGRDKGKKKAISQTACKSSTPSLYNRYSCAKSSRLPLGRRLTPFPPAPPSRRVCMNFRSLAKGGGGLAGSPARTTSSLHPWHGHKVGTRMSAFAGCPWIITTHYKHVTRSIPVAL